MSAITLDEKLLHHYEAIAEKNGVSLGDTLREALNGPALDEPVNGARYVLPTYDMGTSSLDLTKALAFAADLENEQLINKLGLGK